MPTDSINQNNEMRAPDSVPGNRARRQVASESAIDPTAVQVSEDNGVDIDARFPSQDSIESSRELESTFWLQRKDQLTVAILAMLLLIALAVNWFRNDLTDQPVVVEHAAGYRIDLNSASWIEISQLKGIGPALAKRIVESRSQFGPFRSVDDLTRVAGIGAKKLEANKAWISVGSIE